MSSAITMLLMGFYVVLAVVTAFEKRWPTCLYWVGAVIVTSGVLWMSARMEIPR
jgi:drug/metabolite transporter (DMT)-like permease